MPRSSRSAGPSPRAAPPDLRDELFRYEAALAARDPYEPVPTARFCHPPVCVVQTLGFARSPDTYVAAE